MVGKPTSSQSVETEPEDFADKVKKNVMKLKDYDVDKEQREKPVEKTPDPEVLKL